jgi:hypothetical protein
MRKFLTNFPSYVFSIIDTVKLKKQRRMKMRDGLIKRSFVYLLCVSFLLMMNGFPRMVAEAKERALPIGEMVSSGEVKFEAKENVWKRVEASHFPVFHGVKFKTEKGVANIILSDNNQVEMGQNSLLSFDRSDRLCLFQGKIDFRIQPNAELRFKAGKVSISTPGTLQAAYNSSAAPPKNEVTIGSISIHPNGSISVKSIQGSLSVISQDHVILAALSSQESVTIPSTTGLTAPKVMVAQVGETAKVGGNPSSEFLGLSTWEWVGIGLATVAIGAGVGFTVEHNKDEHHDRIPFCLP